MQITAATLNDFADHCESMNISCEFDTDMIREIARIVRRGEYFENWLKNQEFDQVLTYDGKPEPEQPWETDYFYSNNEEYYVTGIPTTKEIYSQLLAAYEDLIRDCPILSQPVGSPVSVLSSEWSKMDIAAKVATINNIVVDEKLLDQFLHLQRELTGWDTFGGNFGVQQYVTCIETGSLRSVITR